MAFGYPKNGYSSLGSLNMFHPPLQRASLLLPAQAERPRWTMLYECGSSASM